jgi:NTP pyrophosphatase (non-canonical NTP hydrolase)
MGHSNELEAIVESRQRGLKVAICGSFRRDPDGLRAAYREFSDAGVTILSPIDPDFVHEENGFVYAAHEIGHAAAHVEARHIQAMLDADLVWLHAPGGYVGTSAAMELGVAHALGLAVYAGSPPNDPVLSGLVRIVGHPADAVATRTPTASAQDAPTRSLTVLQEYYRRAARVRGWSDESPQETLLLLAEELGELTRALRKTENGEVRVAGEDPALELADLALYVVHLANVLSIDLGAAVAAKEAINAARFTPDHQREAA